jgi:hypothetical protein
MMSYEGVDVAWRINAVGIHAFVLKYASPTSALAPRPRGL